MIHNRQLDQAEPLSFKLHVQQTMLQGEFHIRTSKLVKPLNFILYSLTRGITNAGALL